MTNNDLRGEFEKENPNRKFTSGVGFSYHYTEWLENKIVNDCNTSAVMPMCCSHPLHNRQKGKVCGNCGRVVGTTT